MIAPKRQPRPEGVTTGSNPRRLCARMRRMLLVVTTLAFATVAHADADNLIHGRIELQDICAFTRENTLDALLRAQNRNDFTSDIRLTWEPAFGSWSGMFHYVVDMDYGDDVRLMRRESGLLAVPTSTWFDLTERFDDHANFLGSQRIDRLAIAYSTPNFVLRVGRQALTWGSGLVFRPMDLFDPFSPTATDTEWKPGTDMFYSQYLFPDGSDLQFIAVPRADRMTGSHSFAPPLAWNESSFALHYNATIAGHATTLLIARDRGDWVAGLGIDGALSGATWNLELVPTLLRNGSTRVSALANVSDAVTLFDRNTTVFAEYFHSGFGITGSNLSFAAMPTDLLDRLARGQLFNVRQNYLATGFTMEVSPLLHAGPTLIGDLDDGSFYALVQASYSLADDLTLIAGAQAPVGASGSEFGGIRTAPGKDIYLGSPGRI